MSRLTDDLNDPQREAVSYGTGPLLVLAGAGSGKTRVLTYRIAYLLANDMAQDTEITAVTFTNKAALEMRERVETLLGQPLRGGFVGTFHRWSLEILRRDPQAAGLPRRFVIADTDEQRQMIKRELKKLGLDPKEHPPRALLGPHLRSRQPRHQPIDALPPAPPTPSRSSSPASGRATRREKGLPVRWISTICWCSREMF